MKGTTAKAGWIITASCDPILQQRPYSVWRGGRTYYGWTNVNQSWTSTVEKTSSTWLRVCPNHKWYSPSSLLTYHCHLIYFSCRHCHQHKIIVTHALCKLLMLCLCAKEIVDMETHLYCEKQQGTEVVEGDKWQWTLEDFQGQVDFCLLDTNLKKKGRPLILFASLNKVKLDQQIKIIIRWMKNINKENQLQLPTIITKFSTFKVV